ncbi:MAG TPA: aminotransferase class V-fold PLP-dependent enzyme, partial [Ktedonobacterales bacterium]|nr:aminotransferase class V-fold PLP-dependent enzyme [Ktedonobacterales bacterium]
MAWAFATVVCPSCGTPAPANARFCVGCGRRIPASTLSPEITHLPPIEEALAAFQQQYPTYASTRYLDELRAREYARLDQQGQVYLDYTGGGLYAESQLRAHLALLTSHIFGNPHSTNPASQAMTDLVEHARSYVLEYFHADPNEYEVIFTSNASGALKLVGEAYPFGSGGQYLLTFDNHNSVNGIREFARAKGARFSYVPITPPELRVDEAQL